MHEAARALQVGATATRLIAARRFANWYRCERPPSDEAQHLPFIRLADAGTNSDDIAMPAIASDKMIASRFMTYLMD